MKKRTLSERWQALRKRMHGKSKVMKDLKAVEELTDKQIERKELHDKLFSVRLPKRHHAPRKRYKLQALIDKAGMETTSERLRRRLFFASVLVTLLLSAVFLAVSVVNGKQAVDVLVFMAGLWTGGLALVITLAALAVATYMDVRIHQRRQQVEDVLPDFMQLTAANISAGMTIDRALWYAVRPRFGVLAKEIEGVAKDVIAGRELDDALRSFTAKYDSLVLQRSISLLLEGIAAGGRIADLLHKISTDIQEQRILRKEMAANVTTYVIFISFASVLAAPVLFGLATQLLVVIQGIAAGIGDEASAGALTVSPDVIQLVDFQIFSSTVLVISAIMSALIVGTIRKGEAYEGLRYLPFFIITSLTLYFASAWFFGNLFGSFL